MSYCSECQKYLEDKFIDKKANKNRKGILFFYITKIKISEKLSEIIHF